MTTKCNRKEVGENKSSLLLKIILSNTQTLQLFTFNIQSEIVYKKTLKCRAAWLFWRMENLTHKRGEAQRCQSKVLSTN